MPTFRPKITTRKNPGGSMSFCVDAGLINGQRYRKFFSNRRDAKAHRQKMQEARKQRGASAFSLNSKEQHDATQALELLQPYNVTLLDVARYYLKHAQPHGGKKLVSEVVTEFLNSKQKAGRKIRYIEALTSKFERFKKVFGTRYLNEITRTEVEDWLDRQKSGQKTKFEPVTKVNYLRDLGILFEWAMTNRSYCAVNIVKKITKPQVPPVDTEVLTVRQAAALLFAASTQSKELKMVPYIAIGLFAGLRASELEKLDWSHINLLKKELEVKAAFAKTSQHRLVKISDNLAAWLKPHEKMKGRIAPINLYRRLEKICHLAEISDWPQNGMRHSFGSYHYAFHGDANQTASQLGHDSTKMLFKHYRKLMSPTDAQEYFSIYPPKHAWMMPPPAVHLTSLPTSQPAQLEKLIDKLGELVNGRQEDRSASAAA